MLVTVVGVGALGSHLVQFLRNEKVAFRLIDFDRVESKNVLSQFHARPHVGKLKTESMKQSLAFLYGMKLVEGIPHKLVENNVQQLLGKFRDDHLVVDCLDNGEARRLVQDYVRQVGLPCLHGALAPDGSFGRVVWDEQFVIDDETGMSGATCEDGAFLPFIALTAAYLAKAAQEFIATRKRRGYSISPAGAFAV